MSGTVADARAWNAGEFRVKGCVPEVLMLAGGRQPPTSLPLALGSGPARFVVDWLAAVQTTHALPEFVEILT